MKNQQSFEEQCRTIPEHFSKTEFPKWPILAAGGLISHKKSQSEETIGIQQWPYHTRELEEAVWGDHGLESAIAVSHTTTWLSNLNKRLKPIWGKPRFEP